MTEQQKLQQEYNEAIDYGDFYKAQDIVDKLTELNKQVFIASEKMKEAGLTIDEQKLAELKEELPFRNLKIRNPEKKKGEEK